MTDPSRSASTARSMGPSVVLAGGGSAGHVSPLLAIAQAIRRAEPEARLRAVGTKDGLETRLVPAAGFELELIDRVPMPRRPSLAALRFPVAMRRAIAQSREILQRAEAEVLVGVGGYVCTPLYLAAQRLGIPTIIHEANLRPGLANRLGARRAAAIGTAFEGIALPGAQWVGMPMRSDIAHADRAADRESARAALGLPLDATVLVVTGGSLGAVRINQAVAAAAADLVAAGIVVLHLTGAGKQVMDEHGEPLALPGYLQREYLDTMALAYSAADLLVCRSGAGTVSEVAAVGVPAIFVPLPVGNGEQRLNAATLVDRDAALMVADNEFSADWLRRVALPLLRDPARLAELGERAAQRGIRDAAEQMATMTLGAIR
ncbi:undecaprenyldiphospho-muramoylpentapeptide beta-N-acetylglucosaminyltransferase [Psychromicrobium xiongbiense]|uniref:undecaprenyldiphospho-muramoylpentapeptide beta-N-acetylglucosaminyltransferase n=1 Tax=Psychromicrobium xiongbiense TaxID=3051184 RepID=UPI002556408A|nr:undecaprenyldiphospho-muramoylpentapeptide beta-N-acetylglucosaminyltransferase [Psychromicrobium sp. YIM S02556]